MKENNFQLCILALAVVISVSGVARAQANGPVIPTLPLSDYDWTKGDNYVNGLYAVGVSHYNFLQYYDESLQRYGELPPLAELVDATAGWDIYIGSNIPGTNLALKANDPPPQDGPSTISTPEIPLVNRVVTPVNKAEGFRKPLLPPLRLTRDGRIGLVPGTGGVDGQQAPLRIMLNRPEALTKHFLDNSPGIPSIDPEIWEVKDHSKWNLPGSKITHFNSICEDRTKPPSQLNPTRCGNDDCYKFTLVGSAVEDTFTTSGQNGLEGGYRTLYMPQLESGDRLYSREVTIRVSQPKTRQAKITSVEFSDEYKVSPIRQGVLFEPNTPADGRIFVARRQGLPLVWRHRTTGKMHAGSYETVYAVAPETAKACDVTAWGDLRPISHAPFDPLVNSRYSFAKYPFRDPMGNLIPDGADIKGTYPWLDTDARMLSLMISDANLFRNGVLPASATAVFDSRFNARCVHAGCAPNDTNEKANIAQFTVMGAWSKGKMILFDNTVNYADFRIDLANAVELDLYQPGSALPSTSNKSASVELGAYREVGTETKFDEYVTLKSESGSPVLGRDGRAQKYLLKNTSLFDSIEHRMNYNPFMKPTRPHDVVWLVSSGATSDELNFDDMLNNNAFIISEMVAAYSWVNDSKFRMTGFDGWHELSGTFTRQVKVQNGATTLSNSWIVPAAGDVSNGRIEPVGNGGVKGKGMYFNGENTLIRYEIAGAQPKPLESSDWLHSLFLDARGLTEGAERVILSFPDQSRLTMTMADAGSKVRFNAYDRLGKKAEAFLLPASMVTERWLHLGLLKSSAGLITFYVNGYPYKQLCPTGDSLFAMKGGTLVLGGTANTVANQRAFKGWMDDYKVFSYKPDPETICNLAHGTLVVPGSNQNLATQAGLYSADMHGSISKALALRGQQTYASYACFMDNPNADRTAVKHRVPADVVSIRDRIHFPEGPLHHDAPRPDSTTNEFCLACHSSEDRIAGLTVEALRLREIPAKSDPRRQPLQAPPFITGNLPAEFLASIHSKSDAVASVFIDDYVLASSRGVHPEIRNLVLIRNGEAVQAVNARPSVNKSGFSALRVNASGVTTRVVFRVNGVVKNDDRSAPFELPMDDLADGANQLEITTFGANGLQTQRGFSIFLDEGKPESGLPAPPVLGQCGADATLIAGGNPEPGLPFAGLPVSGLDPVVQAPSMMPQPDNRPAGRFGGSLGLALGLPLMVLALLRGRRLRVVEATA